MMFFRSCTLFVVFAWALIALAEPSLAAESGVITYNDTRLSDVARALLEHLEGSFGVLLMTAAGIFAIISAAFGQYRASIALLVVAIGAFTLRSFMSTFFNDVTINGTGGPSSVQGGFSEVAALSGPGYLRVFTCHSSSVVAPEGGTVRRAGELPTGRGRGVQIEHPDGSVSEFGHLNSVSIKAGASIAPGQVIGTVGTSGLSDNATPQLYYTRRRDGRAVSPSRTFPSVSVDSRGAVTNPGVLVPSLVIPTQGCAVPNIQVGTTRISGQRAPGVSRSGNSEIGRF